ncbi:MAG: peptidylprolyl isomerase [Campylobacterales bacterium]|nr:peptidylprolyl isomerase [Campylobacterales bacterium]
MIGWMQKNNRYLVWTIWIATIAFIGAGFVGWGSYKFGSTGDSIAKVGNIEITNSKYQMTYSQLYNYYNQRLQGNLDEEKAKEIGIKKQAFDIVKTQAMLLNLADEFGIIVTDKEVANSLASLPNFQENGTFSKEIYENFLKSQHLKKKTFEGGLRDEMKINKLVALFQEDPSQYEKEIIEYALSNKTKIAYKVITTDDVKVDLSDDALKRFWEQNSAKYMYDTRYNLAIKATDTKDINVTEDEIEQEYKNFNYKYMNENGDPLSLEDAKKSIIANAKIQKSEKQSKLDFLAFKKGEEKPDESITIEKNDPKFTEEIWEAITSAKIGDFIKPKLNKDAYISIQVVNTVDPEKMSFEEAKDRVKNDYLANAKINAFTELLEKTLNNFDASKEKQTGYLFLGQNDNIAPLNDQESLQFLQKLFTTTKEKGIITVSDKKIVYEIIDQKRISVEGEQEKMSIQIASQLKNALFESDLTNMLNEKYPTKIYVKELSVE